MKRRKGRPKNDHTKIGLSVSKEALEAVRIEAARTCRTVSGFFEIAARNEIERAKLKQP